MAVRLRWFTVPSSERLEPLRLRCRWPKWPPCASCVLAAWLQLALTSQSCSDPIVGPISLVGKFCSFCSSILQGRKQSLAFEVILPRLSWIAVGAWILVAASSAANPANIMSALIIRKWLYTSLMFYQFSSSCYGRFAVHLWHMVLSASANGCSRQYVRLGVPCIRHHLDAVPDDASCHRIEHELRRSDPACHYPLRHCRLVY